MKGAGPWHHWGHSPPCRAQPCGRGTAGPVPGWAAPKMEEGPCHSLAARGCAHREPISLGTLDRQLPQQGIDENTEMEQMPISVVTSRAAVAAAEGLVPARRAAATVVSAQASKGGKGFLWQHLAYACKVLGVIFIAWYSFPVPLSIAFPSPSVLSALPITPTWGEAMSLMEAQPGAEATSQGEASTL